MAAADLLVDAREAAGLSQAVLAAAAGTSRPTLSAYEHGRKSPTLDTAARILSEAGFELSITPRVDFLEVGSERGRRIFVPSTLPRLNLVQALGIVQLPLHLNWSDPGRRFNLRDRRQRSRVYEIVLREGGPADVLCYIDGVLLVDLWDELILPAGIRQAWQPLIAGEQTEEVA
jgi:transcriptional regulator with XRE-family HTH domain